MDSGAISFLLNRYLQYVCNPTLENIFVLFYISNRSQYILSWENQLSFLHEPLLQLICIFIVKLFKETKFEILKQSQHRNVAKKII